MNHFEIIPAQSFEGFEQYEDEGGVEHERGRGGARARPPSRRSAPPRSGAKRPMRRGKPRPKPGSKLAAKPRPKPGAKPGSKLGPKRRPSPGPKPGPRPRPRPGPRPLPPFGPGIGLPWLVERIGGGAAMPSGDAPSGAAGGDDRWRCVQACFSGASGAASGAPAGPEPDTGNGSKGNGTKGNGANGNGSNGSASKGGDTDGGDTTGDDTTPGGNGGEPGSEEFEFGNEYEGYVGYEGELEVAAGLLTLSAAIADPRAAGPGIYTLFKEGQRVYVGRSDNLRRRLQQHLLCLTHLKLKPSRFHVKLTPLRDSAPGQRSRVESAVIGRYGRTKQGGQLANVKSREFGY